MRLGAVPLVLLVAAGCVERANPGPRLDAVEPALVTSLTSTPAVLRGAAFFNRAVSDLSSSGPPAVDRDWIVRVAGRELDAVWRDPERLELTLPAGLPAGVHDVTVVAPDGRTATLAGGLTVSDEPVGLVLSVEDAAGGAGGPLTADLVAGDDLVAHAVVRTAAGAFVADLAVTWTLDGLDGQLTPGPAVSATFSAEQSGSGRIRAARAAAGLTGESGPITVAPGPPVSLVIADPAGAPIADRPDLTTDSDRGLAARAMSFDAFGNYVSDEPVTWTLLGLLAPLPGAPAASVSLDFTAPGTGTLSAAHASLPGDVTGQLTVAPGRAATLTASPDSASLTTDDGPLAFGVTAIDADGNPTADLGTVSWSAVGGFGLFDPLTAVLDPAVPGSGVVRVTSSHGPSDDAGVQVVPGRVAVLTVAPDTLTVTQGGPPTAFSATGIDADGNVTGDLGTLTWSIPAGPIAGIDAASGLFTPTAAGVGLIRATSSHGPADDSGQVRVLAAAALTASASAPSPVQVGASFTLTLTVTNTGEVPAANVQPCVPAPSGTASVTMNSGPTPSSAAIAAGGQAVFTWSFTAVAAGSLSFTTCATGQDATTGAAIASPPAVAGPITVLTPAALSATLSLPAAIALDTDFFVDLMVTNTGGTGAQLVAPGLPGAGGSGAATLVSGPSPASATIGPGASQLYRWSYHADAVGDLQLMVSVSGVDALSGAPLAASATSALVEIVEVELLLDDPFADGTSFAFVFGLDGFVFVGPRASGAGAVRFAPDGSAPTSVSFAFPEDTVGNDSRNNSTPPYPSIGRTGCVPDTAACGPDNEDGRGLFRSGTFQGDEWLVAGGGRSGGDLDYVYMTTDSDTTLDFRFVDLAALLGGGTEGFSAMHVFGGRVYLGFPDDGGSRPYFIALATAPPSPGLQCLQNVDAFDLRADDMPGFATTSPAMIDSIADFAGRLYVANRGGCRRATVAQPRSHQGFPGDWANCQPSAAAFTSRVAVTTSKTADITPADRAIPAFASWNGRLFMARNTTVGPQLFRCDPATTLDATQCDPGDWTLVAANATGDLLLTQLGNTGNVAISLLVATPSFLYVGFDNPGQGFVLARTSAAVPALAGDFELLGTPGQGDATNTRIFDAQLLGAGATQAVYFTAGSGSGPVRVFRVRP